MKLSGLNLGQEIIVQMAWGKRKIEFFAYVEEISDMSIFVTPYMHNDSPLELNIDSNGKIVCNIFADSPEDNKRISWRNVKLKTMERNGRTLYCISTNKYNNVSNDDDRREHDRIEVNKKGRLFDPKTEQYHDVTIQDISYIGISFCASKSFDPTFHQVIVLFEDAINDKTFNMKVECNIVRSNQTENSKIWGCKIIGENRDFLLYSFMLKLMSKDKPQKAK